MAGLNNGMNTFGQSTALSLPSNKITTKTSVANMKLLPQVAADLVRSGKLSLAEANQRIQTPYAPLTAESVYGRGSSNGGSTGGGGGYGYSTSNTYNAQLAAEKARQAQRASEAQGIKDQMMGRRGEFEAILNEILGNIDKTYKEESNRRKETYDADSAELLSTLEQALPEIAASFAAIGGYDSSLRGYREMDAEKEHQNSQNELKREYESELGNLGAKANQARTEARTSYNNFMTDFDTLAGTEANSDNLENIRKSQNSLLKGINDFRGQSNIYKPNSTFSNEMKNLGGDYDFGNIRDAFASFLNTTNAGSGGDFQADEKIAEEAKKTTNKVKNEIEQNKSTGVSK